MTHTIWVILYGVTLYQIIMKSCKGIEPSSTDIESGCSDFKSDTTSLQPSCSSLKSNPTSFKSDSASIQPTATSLKSTTTRIKINFPRHYMI